LSYGGIMKHKRKFISLKGMSQLKADEAALNGKIKRKGSKDYVSFKPCGCPNKDCAIPFIRKSQ
jgi:hypothetical protein